jgi:hypothetical protein
METKFIHAITCHTCTSGCNDVMKPPVNSTGEPFITSHDSLTICSASNSSKSIIFPYSSLNLYHLTGTVQESLLPIIHFITLLLSYSHNLLSWPLISLPQCEILLPFSSLLWFLPFSESRLYLYLVG